MATFGQFCGLRFSVALFASFLVNIRASTGSCDAGWSESPSSKSCIKIFEMKKSWSDARNACQQLEGDLVTIRNKDMMSFIMDQIWRQGLKDSIFWIGLHETHENRWSWLEENEEAVYTNWANNSPGDFIDYGELQDCAAVLGLESLWSDFDCSTPMQYICERRTVSSPVEIGAVAGIIIAVVLCGAIIACVFFGLKLCRVFREKMGKKKDSAIGVTNTVA
ncbi:macrophage mannose receptor 1 [Plakobranchus ocellatus]|uniref:Macrophage mannose receptor 1 n=1 Tax=Plakobranchus ocellatus TaxID=259542 RepID=A0AAV3ZUF3_9GAST|nr:macrophage mannose receptor 1 [Plakobranchus ocellatus]